METENRCYLCSIEASIANVRSEHGERFDVLCKGNCPRYIITQSAIRELASNSNMQKEVLSKIKEIHKTGKRPVIRFNDIKREFIYSSEEDEQ